MKASFWLRIILGLCLTSAFTTVALRAQETPVVEKGLNYDDQHFRDLAGKFRCPTCTGLSVLDSEASFSVQIKNQVAEMMKQGKTDAEVVAYFTDRYGPWILREPPKSGFSALAWAIPVALLVIGPVAIWGFAWRRKQVMPNFGVRPAELIAADMQRELSVRRTRRES